MQNLQLSAEQIQQDAAFKADIENIKKVSQYGYFVEVSGETANNLLNCVPPTDVKHRAFLHGEALRHNSQGEAVYYSFRQLNGLYYGILETSAQFKANTHTLQNTAIWQK